MAIVTGKPLRALDLADFEKYAIARQDSGRNVSSLPLAYEILHAIGGLNGLPPTLRQARNRGQLTVAELVDRYPIINRDVRDVLVHYLARALRHARLRFTAQPRSGAGGPVLVQSRTPPPRDLFAAAARFCGAGLEETDPDTAQRQPRHSAHTALFTARSFYLDLLQWSLEDPARWARWAAPCPIGQADIRGYAKGTRQCHARMQQRTRTLIPVLPQLITAAEDQLGRAGRLDHPEGIIRMHRRVAPAWSERAHFATLTPEDFLLKLKNGSRNERRK